MYKLYKARRNKRLQRQINVGGVIHNHCIALHRQYYGRYGKYLSPHQLKSHIAKIKELPKYAWWSQLGSQAIQDIIERIDKGYQRFFQNMKDRQAKKTTQRVGPPTFRKVRKAKSFTLKQAGWKLLGGNRLRIGTTVYKFAKSRDIDGTIKTVTIKRDSLREGASSLGGGRVSPTLSATAVPEGNDFPQRVDTGAKCVYTSSPQISVSGCLQTRALPCPANKEGGRCHERTKTTL